MILEVRHLRVIDAVIKEGGVTRAAERLNLTQPAVSHMIRDLERKLGVQLFRRENRRMQPTAEGFRLLRTARAVLEAVEGAERDLGAFRDGKRGSLRIATQCYTCYRWLPAVLRELRESLPEMELRIVPEATADPLAALLAERIDVALMHAFPSHTEIAAEPLFEDEMVAIFPIGHRLADRDTVTAVDLADEQLLVDFDPETSQVTARVFGAAGVRPRRISRLGLSEAILEAVRNDLGISLVPWWMVESEVADGRLAAARIAPDPVRRRWHAAVLHRNRELASVSELLRLLRTQAEPVSRDVASG